MLQHEIKQWLMSKGINDPLILSELSKRFEPLLEGHSTEDQLETLNVFSCSEAFFDLCRNDSSAPQPDAGFGYRFESDWLTDISGQRKVYDSYRNSHSCLNEHQLFKLLRDSWKQGQLNSITFTFLASRFDFELRIANRHGVDFPKFHATITNFLDSKIAREWLNHPPSALQISNDPNFYNVVDPSLASMLACFEQQDQYVMLIRTWAAMFEEASRLAGGFNINVLTGIIEATLALGNRDHEKLCALRTGFLYVLNVMNLPFDHTFSVEGLSQSSLGNFHGLVIVLSKAASRMVIGHMHEYFRPTVEYPFDGLNESDYERIATQDLMPTIRPSLMGTAEKFQDASTFRPIDLARVVEEIGSSHGLTGNQMLSIYHGVLIQYPMHRGFDLFTELPVSGDSSIEVPPLRTAFSEIIRGFNLITFQLGYLG